MKYQIVLHNIEVLSLVSKVIAVIAKNKLSWNIHRSDQGIGTLGYFYTTTDSFCAATIIIPDQASGHSHERLWRRDT